MVCSGGFDHAPLGNPGIQVLAWAAVARDGDFVVPADSTERDAVCACSHESTVRALARRDPPVRVRKGRLCLLNRTPPGDRRYPASAPGQRTQRRCS